MGKIVMKIVFQFFGILLFISISSYALLAAYGYQINVLTRNIVKTSIIDLSNPLEGVEVYFDGNHVADKTPYQIVNVEPGEHTVTLQKQGFVPWQRKVSVQLNLVKKINDILLLPLEFDIFAKNFNLGFEYDEIKYNRKWVLFISKQENKIRAYKLNDDGSFLIDNINVKLDDKNYAFSFADDNNLVLNSTDKITILNLSDKNLINIKISDDFKNFQTVFTPNLQGFFISEGSLYTADIGLNGDITKTTILIGGNKIEDSDFNVINQNSTIFILLNGGLYLYENNEIELIESKINIAPSLDKEGTKFVFLRGANEIVIYNLIDSTKEFLARFGEKINQLDFFADNKHILIKQNNQLRVCDFDFTNCSTILPVRPEDLLIPSKSENQFIIVSDNQIISYTYQLN